MTDSSQETAKDEKLERIKICFKSLIDKEQENNYPALENVGSIFDRIKIGIYDGDYGIHIEYIMPPFIIRKILNHFEDSIKTVEKEYETDAD